MSHPASADPIEAAPLAPPPTADRPKGAGRRAPTQRPNRGGGALGNPNRERPTETAATVSTTDELLRVLIRVTARVAIPEPRLRALVGGNPRSGDKYIAAYNFCDGSRGVTEIARLADLNQGNLSRTITRWIDQGVMFRLGPESRPVHLYRLSAATRDGDDSGITDDSLLPEVRTSPAATAPRSPRRPRDGRTASRASRSPDATISDGAARPPRESESLELPLDAGGHGDSGR